MEKIASAHVQEMIGYTFNNINLLHQAFTRKSYAQENDCNDNEVLEFIGDKALDLAVIHFLTSRFGTIDGEHENTFSCLQNEGELTKIKSRMVERRNLARRIDEMGFAEYLFLGNGDCNNNVLKEDSVKEDLFEAIVGAVTLDCNWDFPEIISVVDAMLDPQSFLENDDGENYVQLIQEYEQNINNTMPLFRFYNMSYFNLEVTRFEGISQPLGNTLPFDFNVFKIKYSCELKLSDNLPEFRGFGVSKGEARKNACKVAYDYLQRNNLIPERSLKNEIKEPTKDFAINQLEILSRRGYFELPDYVFTQEYDDNGNPIWHCKCSIPKYEKTFCEKSSSKKEAKKQAAYKMLQNILSINAESELLN